MPSIFEILIVVTLAGIALWVTRRRPFWGVLLAVGFAALVALAVALVVPSSPHSSRIHIVEHLDVGNADWEVVPERISSAKVVVHRGAVLQAHDEGSVHIDVCEDTEACETHGEHLLASHEADEPSQNCQDGDCSEIVAEIANESAFEEHPDFVGDASEEDTSEDVLATRELEESQLTGLGEERPAWVYQLMPDLGSTKHIVVQSGPYETQEECDSQLIWAMKDAVRGYIDRYFEDEGRSVPQWFRLELPSEELYEAITREYTGFHDFDVAGTEPMPVKYVELELDEGFHKRVVERYYRQSMQMKRITQSGIGSLGVLGLIAVALGILKAEPQGPAPRRGMLALAIGTSLALLLGFALLMAVIR